MKLLFLDFDGVLNSDDYDPIYLDILRHRQGTDLDRLDPRNCQVLQTILQAEPEARIVISSSWRTHHTQEYLEEILRSKGAKDARVIGMTPSICTGWKDDYRQRSLEIQWWLSQWDTQYGVLPATPIDGFAILEDQEDMCALREHMVWTDPRHGLTEEHVAKVISTLVKTPKLPPMGGTIVDNGEYLSFKGRSDQE